MNDYPHVTITEDGRRCSMGQHHLGFLRVLYDVLLHLGYNGGVPIYHCHMSMSHGLDSWEVSMMIPLNPAEPCMGTVIGSELDNTVKQMTHVALTSLCESHLATTATMPNTLFPIRNQGDPVWKQCLEAVSNLKGPRFHASMAVMIEHIQYSFNLQHNLTRTTIQQHLSTATCHERNTAILRDLG
jgi:hypothetical protein